jgi:hypothetical protein
VSDPAPDAAAVPRAPWRKRLLLPLLAVLLLTLAGVLLVLREEKKTEAVRLQALADAKAQQAANWVRERRRDLRVLGGGAYLGNLHHRWREAGEVEAGAVLATRLSEWRIATGADVMLLLDALGSIVWTSQPGATAGVDAAALAALPARGAMLDPRAVDGRVAVGFLVPLSGPSNGRNPVLLMRVWAEKALLPVLTRWPLPSASGEARMAWRAPDGQSVGILHPLREGAAHRAGLLQATPDSAAARMVHGRVAPVEAFEGIDPLGAPTWWWAGPCPARPGSCSRAWRSRKSGSTRCCRPRWCRWPAPWRCWRP